jgi:hypothetical protein
LEVFFFFWITSAHNRFFSNAIIAFKSNIVIIHYPVRGSKGRCTNFHHRWPTRPPLTYPFYLLLLVAPLKCTPIMESLLILLFNFWMRKITIIRERNIRVCINLYSLIMRITRLFSIKFHIWILRIIKYIICWSLCYVLLHLWWICQWYKGPNPGYYLSPNIYVLKILKKRIHLYMKTLYNMHLILLS